MKNEDNSVSKKKFNLSFLKKKKVLVIISIVVLLVMASLVIGVLLIISQNNRQNQVQSNSNLNNQAQQPTNNTYTGRLFDITFGYPKTLGEAKGTTSRELYGTDPKVTADNEQCWKEKVIFSNDSNFVFEAIYGKCLDWIDPFKMQGNLSTTDIHPSPSLSAQVINISIQKNKDIQDKFDIFAIGAIPEGKSDILMTVKGISQEDIETYMKLIGSISRTIDKVNPDRITKEVDEIKGGIGGGDYKSFTGRLFNIKFSYSSELGLATSKTYVYANGLDPQIYPGALSGACWTEDIKFSNAPEISFKLNSGHCEGDTPVSYSELRQADGKTVFFSVNQIPSYPTLYNVGLHTWQYSVYGIDLQINAIGNEPKYEKIVTDIAHTIETPFNNFDTRLTDQVDEIIK